MFITHGELKHSALNIKSSYRLHADCSIIHTVTMVTTALWTTARSGYERVRVSVKEMQRCDTFSSPSESWFIPVCVLYAHVQNFIVSDIGTNSEEHTNMRCFTWLELT